MMRLHYKKVLVDVEPPSALGGFSVLTESQAEASCDGSRGQGILAILDRTFVSSDIREEWLLI